jgi:hypothetical protein
MKTLTAGAMAIVAGLTSVIPAYAFPVTSLAPVQQSDVIPVGDHGGHRGGHDGNVWRSNGQHQHGYANHGHSNYGYYNHGYHGHYDHDGNSGAIIGGLAAGAIIGGIIASQQSHYSGNSHSQYCADRYRSYRAYDNTFQPNYGPRVQCR